MRFFIPLNNTQSTPFDERALQARFPDVGNPAGLPAADLAARGYAEITVEATPVIDPTAQYLGNPVNEQVAGAWVRRSPVLNWTQAEIDAREAAEFDHAQAGALYAIDGQAEAARLKYITGGAGQAMSYQVKAEEAKDCLANHTAATPPAVGVYPLLDSEVGIMANADATITANAFEVAVVVDSTRAGWLQVEAAINRVRVQAKANVKAAATAAEVEIILAAIVWP